MVERFWSVKTAQYISQSLCIQAVNIFFPVSSNNGFLKFSGEILLKFYLKISMSCRRLAVQNLPSIILLVTCLQK